MKIYIKSSVATDSMTLGRGYHESHRTAQKYNMPEANVADLFKGLIKADMAVLDDNGETKIVETATANPATKTVSPKTKSS
jgi:hypothetical protein